MSQTWINAEAQATKPKLATLGLTAVFLTYFLASLMIYGLNIAGPMIAADLNGMQLYSWAISLPALAAAFVTLIFGKLSDMYGRRAMLIISLIIFLIGAILSATSPTFVLNIAARVVFALGFGALAALCFSVIGDLYAPAERSKWTGLLAVSAGVAATAGPIVVGMITDNLSWRYFFWFNVPLAIVCGVLIVIGVPSLTQRTAHKIDIVGSCLLAVASSSMILGFSLADRYAWTSKPILGLLAISLIFWCLFFWIERRAEEPILDPQVFTNRTFLTCAVAALLSFFGFVGILNYYPLFLQGLQGTSATLSGKILTPFSMLMAFTGVPAGLLLAKTKRYKWMFVLGYGILTVSMYCMVTFDSETPLWLGVLVTGLGGLGLGSIPTINTLVVQFALPKRLLGVGIAAIFFVVALGNAITPAILGSVMNSMYAKALQNSLPHELNRIADEATLASLADPRVLMSPQGVAALRDVVGRTGNHGSALFDQTVQAVRGALEAGLKMLFLIGAITMLVSFLIITTIPEISMDVEVRDKKQVATRDAASDT
jgi:MFS family permease